MMRYVQLIHLRGYLLSRSFCPCQCKNYFNEISCFYWLQPVLMLLSESLLPSGFQWLHFTHISGNPPFLSSVSPPWLLICWLSWLSTSLSESLIPSLTSIIIINPLQIASTYLPLLILPSSSKTPILYKPNFLQKSCSHSNNWTLLDKNKQTNTYASSWFQFKCMNIMVPYSDNSAVLLCFSYKFISFHSQTFHALHLFLNLRNPSLLAQISAGNLILYFT